jgi:hypothetical protein
MMRLLTFLAALLFLGACAAGARKPPDCEGEYTPINHTAGVTQYEPRPRN